MSRVTKANANKFSSYTIQRFKTIQMLLNQLNPQAPSRALVVPGSPMPEGKIIVFPGSFNPPTLAHLALLRQAWQFARVHGPMRIYAALSTHITDKERVERPLLLDRINLLETVLRNHVRHTAIMLFNRGLYVEQAEAVCEELSILLDRPENRQYAGHVHALPLSAAYRYISSTRIRQVLSAHEQEIPAEVRRFIHETHVYEPPVELQDGTKIDQYGERMRAIESAIKFTNVEK